MGSTMDSSRDPRMVLLLVNRGVQMGFPLDEETSQTQIGDANIYFQVVFF